MVRLVLVSQLIYKVITVPTCQKVVITCKIISNSQVREIPPYSYCTTIKCYCQLSKLKIKLLVLT